MSIRLEDRYATSFFAPAELAAMENEVKEADRLLRAGKGPGSDFLGWIKLPKNYDKEEFARIKVAAKKIQKKAQALVVIGIGGSYLGARAVIE